MSVRGPESYIKSLDFISTEKIDVENRSADFTTRQVGLNVVNPKATLIDTVVDVFVKIGEKRIERLFIVPVHTETQNRTATVVLYGAHTLLDALKPESLQVETAKTDSGEKFRAPDPARRNSGTNRDQKVQSQLALCFMFKISKLEILNETFSKSGI